MHWIENSKADISTCICTQKGFGLEKLKCKLTICTCTCKYYIKKIYFFRVMGVLSSHNNMTNYNYVYTEYTCSTLAKTCFLLYLNWDLLKHVLSLDLSS